MLRTLKTSRFGPRRARSKDDIIGVCGDYCEDRVHGTIGEKREVGGRSIELGLSMGTAKVESMTSDISVGLRAWTNLTRLPD
jgi:hypothetical protein